jgi:hypothetical protein
LCFCLDSKWWVSLFFLSMNWSIILMVD